MSKIFCINEAKTEIEKQKERVKEDILKINEKIKEIKEKANNSNLSPKEKSRVIKSLYEEVEKLLKKYGLQEQKRFNKIKKYLIKELTNNKDLINEYKYSIDEFRKDYKPEDIDEEKVEEQISILEDKIKKLENILKNEKNEIKDLYFLDEDLKNANSYELLDKEKEIFKPATRHYAKQLTKYKDDLYEYKAIKVIALLGKTNPEKKIQQYQEAIERTESEFKMGTANKFLTQLEIDLGANKTTPTKEAKNQKEKDRFNSIKNSTILKTIIETPTIQEAKGMIKTLEDISTNMIKKSPNVQTIVNTANKMEDKLKNNYFDFKYIMQEKDLIFEPSTYAKTQSETYVKNTLDRKKYNSHNTFVKKMNTTEGRMEFSNKVKKLLKLKTIKRRKTDKSQQVVYTERKHGMLSTLINKAKELKLTLGKMKKDKFGYLIPGMPNVLEILKNNQHSQLNSKQSFRIEEVPEM